MSAECVVGDEFGCANLIAKDRQLNLVTPGAFITIRNAYANVVKEHLQLEIDRLAKLEKTADEVTKVKSVKLDNNLSNIEYELVEVKNLVD